MSTFLFCSCFAFVKSRKNAEVESCDEFGNVKSLSTFIDTDLILSVDLSEQEFTRKVTIKQ
jgi:hypothetical protein